MKIRSFIFFISVICYQSIFSQEINVDEAKEIASNFLNGYNFDDVIYYTPTNNIKRRNETLCDSISDYHAFYILNDTDNNAFVIVGGDKRMKQVLGFSKKTSFNIETMPCGLEMLLSQYEAQFDILHSSNTISSNDLEVKKLESDIAPIIKTRWGQSFPYNKDCPSGCPSGCVATAMAQIMNYYSYPTQGKGEHSYVSNTNKYFLSFDFADTTFDWDNMLDDYSKNSGTSLNQNAVSCLMKACGVSVGMDYNTGESGALDVNIPYALINFFSYNKYAACIRRDYYKSTEWYDEVFKELEAGRPILYCGRNYYSTGGHAFIIDGYRRSDELFHVNWGWNGDWDSYYSLDALDPNHYRFSSDQSMIIGFVPEDSDIPMDVFYANSFLINNTIKTDKELDCSIISVYNFSNSCSSTVSDSYFSGYIGIGLYDSNLNYIKTIDKEYISQLRFHDTYVDGFTRVDLPITISSGDLTAGETYYIAPCVRSVSSKTPTRIRTYDGRTDYYKISLDDDQGGDDTEIETTTIFKEEFETNIESKGWSQEHIRGDVFWEQKNTRDPSPIQGNGLVVLHSGGDIGASSIYATRLISPEINSTNSNEFVLELHYQNRSISSAASEQISILLDDGCNNEWETIYKQKAASPNTWATINVPFTANKKFKIAIDGYVISDGYLYVDDLQITSKTLVSSVSLINELPSSSCQFYSITGTETTKIVKGFNIIKYSDGTTKKIFSK